MPIYEYYCADCRRKVSVFFRSLASVGQPSCPRCGGENLERRFSRVVVRRGAARERGAGDFEEFEGDESELGGFDHSGVGGAEPDFGLGTSLGMDSDLDDADPRALARWTRQLSESMGEPLDAELDTALADIERGADVDEVVSRLEESETFSRHEE